MKLNKVSRMLFALAALMLGGILQNATGMQLFFWLGIIGCVGIFGFLGRGEEFKARKSENAHTSDDAQPEEQLHSGGIAQNTAQHQRRQRKQHPGNLVQLHRVTTVSSSALRLSCMAEGLLTSAG